MCHKTLCLYTHCEEILPTKQNIFDNMIKIKNIANQSKIKSNTICASSVLQKVLNTPSVKAITLLYSRLYAYYNFSENENGTRNAYCFSCTNAFRQIIK